MDKIGTMEGKDQYPKYQTRDLKEDKKKRLSRRRSSFRLLPDFMKACRGDENTLIIHQDSFAAGYQQDEYTLRGMAIKFAGLHGKEVRIIGTNRETLKGTGKPELVQ